MILLVTVKRAEKRGDSVRLVLAGGVIQPLVVELPADRVELRDGVAVVRVEYDSVLGKILKYTANNKHIAEYEDEERRVRIVPVGWMVPGRTETVLDDDVMLQPIVALIVEEDKRTGEKRVLDARACERVVVLSSRGATSGPCLCNRFCNGVESGIVRVSIIANTPLELYPALYRWNRELAVDAVSHALTVYISDIASRSDDELEGLYEVIAMMREDGALNRVRARRSRLLIEIMRRLHLIDERVYEILLNVARISSGEHPDRVKKRGITSKLAG